MKENERIIEMLLSNGFLFDENIGNWIRDEWNIRFFKEQMEIYEEIDKVGRYLHTQLDYDTLKEILEEI